MAEEVLAAADPRAAHDTHQLGRGAARWTWLIPNVEIYPSISWLLFVDFMYEFLGRADGFITRRVT